MKHGRVNGDLATARTFGEFRFKNAQLSPERHDVTVTPYMTVLWRSKEEDQVLIMACDGIWDVMSNL